MASVTDTVLNMILIIVFFTLLATIVTSTIIQNNIRDLQQDRNVLQEEQIDLGITAILFSTENKTGRPISELIGEAIYGVETELLTEEGVVDVVSATQERFDMVFGEDNYFLTIDPIVQGVSLMFVIDSSLTVSSEREAIAAGLEYIRDETKSIIETTGEEQVHVTIFLLPTGGESDCALFNDLALDIPCIQLNSEQLYEDLLEVGWERPGFSEGVTYGEWRDSSPAAEPIDFTSSDWAAGVANAALFYENNFFLQSSTNLNLIFPLSDELTTTSKADSCFNEQLFERFLVCNLCNAECPEERSLTGISQAIPFVVRSGSAAFPIYSVNCDFRYTDGWNVFSSDPQLANYLDPPRTPIEPSEFPESSWCAQEACGACSVGEDAVDERGFPLMCTYEPCQELLLEHMELLASETGGRVFNINDADEIPDNIIEAFESTIAKFNFTIGEQREDVDRFVYEKVIPLTDVFRGRLQVWVYEEG